MTRRDVVAAGALLLLVAACNGDSAASGNAAAGGSAAKAVPPPKGGDWAKLVVATPAGGFAMGNPRAPVKLVEFGSLTCSHCADFAANGEPALIRNYVKTGRVQYEFRNFVRDPFDLTAALISRCGGARPFFALTSGLFKDQANWIGKLQSVSPAQQQALAQMPPARQFAAIADWSGLQKWAAMRGVPTARSSACLASQQEIDRLVKMNQEAVANYAVPGTPAFLINGKLVENAANWQQLEPKIKFALGG